MIGQAPGLVVAGGETLGFSSFGRVPVYTLRGRAGSFAHASTDTLAHGHRLQPGGVETGPVASVFYFASVANQVSFRTFVWFLT